MPENNKILIVEPDATSAAIMRLYLEKHGLEVCQIVTDADAGVWSARMHRPDLLITEVSIEHAGDGVEAADRVLSILHVPVVFATCCYDEAVLHKMSVVSPIGLLSKPLREADMKAVAFLALCDRDGTQSRMKRRRRVLETSAIVREALQRTYNLTGAEARVVATIVQEPEIRQVADELCISLDTVRTHLKNIFSKTGTHKQAALLHEVLTGPASVYMSGVGRRRGSKYRDRDL